MGDSERPTIEEHPNHTGIKAFSYEKQKVEASTSTLLFCTYDWWAVRDSDPRPIPCKGIALTN